jgi:hypothetical protein
MTIEEIKQNLSCFTGTAYHWSWSPLFRTMHLTDGTKYVADACGAYWLMDAIASHQVNPKVRGEEFQVWTFKRRGSSGWILTATDDNGHEIARQDIGFSDFPLEEITLWVEGPINQRVILLPSER